MPTDALSRARFTGVATFLRLPHITDPEELEVALVGVPFDGGTTYRPGPQFGPRHLRGQSAIIRPWNPVLNVNPFAKHRTADYGDLSVNPLSIEDTFRRIETGIALLLAAGAPQVGGLTSVQILELVRALRGLQMIGRDLVEVSPPYDTGEITCLLAANLLLELLCVL